MSTPTHEELRWRFGKAEDSVIEARRHRLLDFLLETSPQKSGGGGGKVSWKVG
jgi:hypothetical protein